MNHALVHTIPLFAGVKRRRRLELAALADEITIPAGTTLTREGARADEFFVIVEGEADVVARRPSPVQRSHAPTRLATLGAGEFFGEIGLIDGVARSATVVAVTPMRLLVAGPREFGTLMHSFPAVAERIRAAFAARTSRGRENKMTGQLPERKSSHMEDTIKHEEQSDSRRWKALAVWGLVGAGTVSPKGLERSPGKEPSRGRHYE